MADPRLAQYWWRGKDTVIIATGQTTAYAPGDDGSVRKGTAKAYIVNNTGPYAGSTNIDVPTYGAFSITFTAATKKISDPANGLAVVKTGDTITCPGSPLNPGPFTVAVGNVAAEIVVNEALVGEAGSATVFVTICKRASHSNQTAMDNNVVVGGAKREWMSYTSSGEKVGPTSAGKLAWYDVAQAVTIYSSANTISCTAPNLMKIVGGAGLVGNFHVGHCYQFAGFATAMNNLTGGWECTVVAVNGADLDLTFKTYDFASFTSEGAVGDSIKVVCNSIFAYCAACNAASVSGKADWRATNRFEFDSIRKYEPPSARSDVVAFPADPVDDTWLTTTLTDNAANAYLESSWQGIVETWIPKTGAGYAHLLRGP